MKRKPLSMNPKEKVKHKTVEKSGGRGLQKRTNNKDAVGSPEIENLEKI